MKPKEIERLVAEYQNTRNARLLLDEESKKMKVAEDGLLDKLTAAGGESGKYGPYTVKVVIKPVPRCTDWNAFYDYLRKTGNLDMLTKHLTASAIMARLEAGEYVPAIVTDDKVTYKIS